MANRLMPVTSTNLLRVHIAVSCGTRSLAYLVDMSRSLRSVLLAIRPLATVSRDALPCISLFCVLLAQGAGVSALELSDPTRPAATLDAGESSTDADAQAEQNQTRGLRLIIIQKNRRAAIIDGKTIELGGKVGDARLVEVNEGSVVLQGARSKQVMTLFPYIKTRRPPDAAVAPTAVEPSDNSKTIPVADREKK